MTQSSSVERLVGEIDEFGYTVVEDVLDADSVAAYLADTRRLERELPTGYGLYAGKMGRIDWRPPADYLDADRHPFLDAVADRLQTSVRL